MSAFVGTQTVQSSEELRSLLHQLKSENSCFFLRWPHRVSEFCTSLPDDFPSPEGQMFDSQKEVRWKQQGQGYSILLLSTEGENPDFEPVGKSWTFEDQEAHLYRLTETRLPKGIDSSCNGKKINIEQRYFADPQTTTVHFVALVVK